MILKGTITKVINQLKELEKHYTTVLEVIKK